MAERPSLGPGLPVPRGGVASQAGDTADGERGDRTAVAICVGESCSYVPHHLTTKKSVIREREKLVRRC